MERRTLAIALGILGAAGALALVAWGFHTWQTTATVTDLRWSREIPVERWMQVTEEGWDVPPGGAIVDSERRQRGTDRYACGTETTTSMGTPTTRTTYCTRPVYDDWYTYTIWRWVRVRVAQAAGGPGAPPRWPSVTIDAANPVNPEREGQRVAHYRVFLHGDDGKDYETEVDLELWQAMDTGQRLGLTIDWLGRVIDLRAPGWLNMFSYRLTKPALVL